jgi:uncharacterized protein (TIGR01777 family)
MTVTITGATGFIGKRLTTALLAEGHSVHALSRRSGASVRPGARVFAWNPMREAPPREALEGAGAVVHLAGEPVAQRWTPEAKRRIRVSRVEGTRRLVEALGGLAHRPPVLVCASATGIYGARGNERLTEASPAGGGFLAEVVKDWEREADAAAPLGIRVVKLRTGIVLAAHGGALARMLPVFRIGVGGTLGWGEQWMSWIHLDDLVSLIRFALDRAVSGALNAVAPNPVTNADFTRTLAAVLHRPALFPVPPFALRLAFGEMAQVLLDSQRVLPEAATAAGFSFSHPELRPALTNILKAP